MELDNKYRLPKNIKPKIYYINFTLNFDNFTFSGKESINLYISEETSEIRINANDIKIDSVKLNNFNCTDISYGEEIIIMKFKNIIKKGRAKLELNFHGKLREDMMGFYKSNYILPDGTNNVMATTQFEPSDARKAFPCFDEPNIKAKFNITFTNLPKDFTAISNMPIKKEKLNNKFKSVEFEETPNMSTYLIAFVIGHLEYLEAKTNNNIIVKVFTTPGKKEQGKLALDVAVKSINFYNNYFGVDYPMPKMDMVAIPDFDAGAMENWGLITYRETALLFDEKNSSAANKQRVALIIAHELAHQWFGNLVTMDWWNDLWLNEGFASWIEYKAIDSIFPKWKIWTQFLFEDQARALKFDALETSHAIEVEVKNPDEIGEIFDAVSYSKGASIIKMLECYLGEDIFRKGLQHYIKSFLYGNAKTNDLWKSLELISKKPVGKIMGDWTKQTGYPVVSVSSTSSGIKLKQKRFFYIKNNENTIWHIPLTIEEDGKIIHYDMKEKEITLESKCLVNVNASQSGYFIVNYDKPLLNQFIELIKQNKLNLLDRFGIQNNTYLLSRAGLTKLINFLDLALAYKKEKEYAVWSDLSLNLEEIGKLFYKTSFNETYNKIIQELFFDIYKKLGWKPKENEDHASSLLRMIVLNKLGLNGNKEVVNKAKELFNKHLKGNLMHPDIRGAVYSIIAYAGDEKTYDSLLNLYNKSNLQQEKIKLLVGLGMFKQPKLAKKYLKFSLSKEVRWQDVIYCFASMANNLENNHLLFPFLKNNWEELCKRYSEGHMLSNIIKSSVINLKDIKDKEDVKNFFSKNMLPNIKRAVAQSLETIQINRNLFNNNKDELLHWNFTNN